MRILTLAPLALLTVSLAGCANLAVAPSSPHPNVMLPADKTPAALVLAPQIPQSFTVPGTASVNEVPVRG